MKIKEFCEILSYYVGIDVQKLQKGIFDNFSFRVFENPVDQIIRFPFEFYEIFHRSERLFRKLFIIQHFKALVINDLCPLMLDRLQVRVDFAYVDD